MAIRRWQATLARERLGNAELAWQYLDKAQQKSPGDPLIMPDLIAMAEAQGAADLAILLQHHREDQLRICAAPMDRRRSGCGSSAPWRCATPARMAAG